MKRFISIFLSILFVVNIVPVFAAEECEHVFKDYVVTKAASCLETGLLTAYCEKGCGSISTSIDPKRPHIYFDKKCFMCQKAQTFSGDADMNNEINSRDVALLRRYIAGYEGVILNLCVSDVIYDDEITAKDVTSVRRAIAGVIPLDELTCEYKTVELDNCTGEDVVTDYIVRLEDGYTYKFLPTPQRDYHKFLGWYTDSTNGDLVDSDTLVNEEDSKLYAHWELKPSSDWSTSVPQDAQVLESKLQYSYSDYETTTSTSSNTLDGWEYVNTTSEYSDWVNAGWTKTQPTASDLLQITDSKTVTDSYAYTIYNLYFWKYWNSSAGAYYHTYSAAYAQARGGTKYTASCKSTECTKAKVYDGHQAYKYNNTSVWFLESTKDVPGVTHQEWYYQTRTNYNLHHFQRWTDWTEYSDIVAKASDTKLVKTRTVYIYREK